MLWRKWMVLRASQCGKSRWHFLQGCFPPPHRCLCPWDLMSFAGSRDHSIPSSFSHFEVQSLEHRQFSWPWPGAWQFLQKQPARTCGWNRINPPPRLGKQLLAYTLVTAALAVSSSKGKDTMSLIEKEICSTTHAFNPLWRNWLPKWARLKPGLTSQDFELRPQRSDS